VGCGTGALSQIIFEHGLPNAIKGIDSSADFVTPVLGRARPSNRAMPCRSSEERRGRSGNQFVRTFQLPRMERYL
jgi:hypothetical protein